MNKLLIIPLIVTAPAFVGSSSAADAVFDSPGPGYHQQIERAFHTAVKEVSVSVRVGNPIIYVVPSSFSTPTLPIPEFPTLRSSELTNPKPTVDFSSALSPFSAPIRVSIDHSVAGPKPRAEQQLK